ncbi:hypothetical protein J479_2311 [Acinetobacter baumannii 1297]|nr:hypothetical protein J479_2311 [Acinetobacter baumannii 1297]
MGYINNEIIYKIILSLLAVFLTLLVLTSSFNLKLKFLNYFILIGLN